MNQLNLSEELDSSNTFYTSFWTFELKYTFSLKKILSFSFSVEKNNNKKQNFLGENSSKILVEWFFVLLPH